MILKPPQFNNVPNPYIKEGHYWKSRASSVDAFIFALAPKEIEYGQLHVLIIKRSENMEAEPNKYGVPCGYLDWGETLYDAIIREVYEETSLYLPNYEKYLEFDNNKQPFFIDSKPNSFYNERQNVGHQFIFTLDFSERSINEFPSHIEKFTSTETSLVKWLPWYDFIVNDFEWSFNHDQKIKDALSYFMQGFANQEWYYKTVK